MSELTRKKNESSEIMFAMVDSTSPANLKSGLTVTDDPYYRDGAGAWTALSIADAATEIGSTGMYTIEMTAAELNHDLILIKLTATGAADTIVVIRTTTHDIDDVNTVVPDAAGVAPTVTEIRQEMDTNSTKMAPSQTLAEYKATGFSTHSAADVKTSIEQAGSHLALILADTGELQTNQGDWLTATGFSTHNAAAVWSVATRILTANTNLNDLTAAEVKAEAVAALADIKLDHLINIAVDTNFATTVHLDSVIGQLADVGASATFDRTTDALEAIRNVEPHGSPMVGTNSAALASVCTETRLAELDAANIPTDLSTIDTVVDGIQTDLNNTTDGLGALKALIDTIDGIVDAILLDTGTDGVVVATGSKTGYALTAAGVDAILDEVIEGSLTLRQIQRINHAVLAGKSTGGGGTTLTFKDVADTKARVTATVDGDGNRTAMTNDGT